MKKSKLTVTIGITAYNEQENIIRLISDVLSQRGESFTIQKIIIASDGSDDLTVEKVKNLKKKHIRIIVGKEREGKGFRLNEIISTTNSDILVLLDADIRLEKNDFIQKLVTPIETKKADFTCPLLVPVKPKNIIGKSIFISDTMKNYVQNRIRKGNNLLNCRGAARAMSKELYTQLYFTKSVHEDAYSYLFAQKSGFKFVYVKETRAYYKLPSTLADHWSQSNRFFSGRKILFREFGRDKVSEEYHIPFLLGITACFLSLIRSPFYTLVYLLILVSSKIRSLFLIPEDKWTVAKSAKFAG